VTRNLLVPTLSCASIQHAVPQRSCRFTRREQWLPAPGGHWQTASNPTPTPLPLTQLNPATGDRGEWAARAVRRGVRNEGAGGEARMGACVVCVCGGGGEAMLCPKRSVEPIRLGGPIDRRGVVVELTQTIALEGRVVNHTALDHWSELQLTAHPHDPSPLDITPKLICRPPGRRPVHAPPAAYAAANASSSTQRSPALRRRQHPRVRGLPLTAESGTDRHARVGVVHAVGEITG
jgi:hypothetical protein